MRIARVVSCCLPLTFAVPTVWADDGKDKDGRKEIQEKIEKIIHEAKEASDKGDKERAEDLEKLAHEIQDSVKKHVDAAQAKVQEAIQKVLHEADKAKERGDQATADKIAKKGQKVKEKEKGERSQDEAREHEVRAIEEKLAEARKVRNQLRDEGREEQAEKAQKEVDALKKAIAEINEHAQARNADDARAVKARKAEGEAGGKGEKGEKGERAEKNNRGDGRNAVDVFREDRKGPDRGKDGPRGGGPPGPPGVFAMPMPAHEISSQIEKLRHEIGELRGQLHHVEDLLEELHRARDGGGDRNRGPRPTPEPRKGRFENFERPVPPPPTPGEPGLFERRV